MTRAVNPRVPPISYRADIARATRETARNVIIVSTVDCVMIQAARALLERARQSARTRGIIFPQLVRDVLEREVTIHGD
jgi:hypothetical protein